jgi:hypothetical protein
MHICTLSEPVKDEGKNVKKYIRRASVELWRAKVPHSTIRSQLKMLRYLKEGPGL